MNYKIYILTNIINNKYYIGQTKLSLARRWSAGYKNRGLL